jgi:hypothetical protein
MESNYYKSDNNLYEWAKATQSTAPDFIYFDEEEGLEGNKRKTDPIDNLRLIFATFIQASDGNMHVLQAYMGLFSGLSLRECGKLVGKSHEWVRGVAKDIEETNPDLYQIMTRKGRNTVSSIIPVGKYAKWKFTDLETGKVEYISSITAYCEKHDLKYDSVYYSIRRDKDFEGRIKITRNY